MNKDFYTYPAVFTYEDDGVSVEFPDIDSCVAFAEDKETAYKYAQEMLGISLIEIENMQYDFPEISDINEIETDEDSEIVFVTTFLPDIRNNIISFESTDPMLRNIFSITRDAGNIIKNVEMSKDKIMSKEGKANFVTYYDTKVQNYLKDSLLELYPDAVFIGEEDKEKNNYDLNDGRVYFIIDPIDGTTNFICGYNFSSISVGVVKDGKAFIGVVFNPYTDEIFYSKRGEGAYLNGSKINCKNIHLSEGIAGLGTSPYNPEKIDFTFDVAKKVMNECLDIRRGGSSALEICFIACGRMTLYYECVLSPWDYCAASLILEEAGGKITTLDNKDITFDKKQSIVAGNKISHSDFIKLINDNK